MKRLYAFVYFAAQRMRHGVTPHMISDAGQLLELPLDDLVNRASKRLTAVHGSHFKWEDLLSAPPVERSTLAPTASFLLQQPARTVAFEARRTSGSTGTPFAFPKDLQMTAWMDAAMWAVYGWHGISPGAPHARFWGAPLDPFKRRRITLSDTFLNRTRIRAFELSRASTGVQFRKLLARNPEYGYGYPTLMRAFADNCVEAGLDGRELGLRVVISTGELLTPQVRSELRDFFGCPVVNEYGCTESGIVAFECERGGMHIVPIAIWPEVVSPDFQPAAVGVEGEVVISDLYGQIMPLLRYRLHDRAVMHDEACPCGRQLPTLNVATGRSDSFIVTPHGKIYDAILAYSVPARVLRFKARQVDLNRIEAKVVPKPGMDAAATAAECQARWKEVLGPGLSIHVEPVNEIPPEPSGKLRYFVPLEREPAAAERLQSAASVPQSGT